MKDYPVKKRFLVVSRALPVESAGTMIVIRRLLENFDGREVVVLGRRSFPFRLLNEAPLACPAYEIWIPLIKGYRIWRMFSVIPGFFIGLYALYRHRIGVIVGVYQDEGSLLLAYLLSVISRKPLMAFFCDLYLENKRDFFHKWIAKYLQRRVFNRSAALIVNNKGMQEFFFQRYGLNSCVIPSAINTALPSQFSLPRVGDGPFIIGFSGSVIADRIDPLQCLIKSIGNNSRYEVRLFTPQSEDFLKNLGIWASNVSRKFCSSQEELLQELRLCHAAYLPLTFQKGYSSEEQLSTCFGTKCYEYFQSCRPVIVHCPSNYFTSRFFSEQQCGEAITTMEIEQVKFALDEFIKNYCSRAEGYVSRALLIAESFTGPVLAKNLTDLINDVQG